MKIYASKAVSAPRQWPTPGICPSEGQANFSVALNVLLLLLFLLLLSTPFSVSQSRIWPPRFIGAGNTTMHWLNWVSKRQRRVNICHLSLESGCQAT